MTTIEVYRQIASTLSAYQHCQKNNLIENEVYHHNVLQEFSDKYFPSGSGFNNGTSLILYESTPERLVFQADFHHMDENGFYDGWSEHKVIITSSLIHGFNIRVTGRDKNDIKEYIAEVFSSIGN